MREQLEKRLNELKIEYQSGQIMLAELESKQASLRENMLRISGAIQVLEEELNKNGSSKSELVEENNFNVLIGGQF
jgi:predicted nuclease with TOPRIM domain